MGVFRYSLKRLFTGLILILCVIVFNFTLIHLAPGDPAEAIAGETATLAQVELIREKYGLNRPFHQQLIGYIVKIIQGDLGYSYLYMAPVLDLFLERIPSTLILVIPSLFLSLFLGIVIGTFSAKKFPSKTDTGLLVLSRALHATPVFWMGLILMLTFALT
jgi:peptide/nickel transport system permease protein